MSVLRKIPAAVVQRLPQYLAFVRDCRTANGQYVRSEDIAYALGLTPSTVRQDFTHLDFSDGRKRGYDIAEIERGLTRVLDVDKEKRVVIAGAGNLGRALALHGNLGTYGFHVRGIVDIDPKIVGKSIGKFVVQNIKYVANIIREERIEIGVIAVPAKSAQNVADRLILGGVRGLLNLAFTRIVAPRRVPVCNVRIVSGLLVLSAAMTKWRRSPCDAFMNVPNNVRSAGGR